MPWVGTNEMTSSSSLKTIGKTPKIPKNKVESPWNPSKQNWKPPKQYPQHYFHPCDIVTKKKGWIKKTSCAQETHGRNTNLGNFKIPSIPTTYIVETTNLMLPEFPLVLLICQNKIQCSMCELPINKYMVISH